MKIPAKRIVLIGVQHGQTVSAEGYVCQPVRTGAERILAHRTDKNFAKTAEQDGKVLKIEQDGKAAVMLVKYKDGSEETFDIGRTYGKFGGTMLPNDLTTDLKEGMTFQQGDALVYNRNYFSVDPMDKKQLLWKSGALARVAFIESTDTHEDSSAITRAFADRMTTHVTEIIPVRLDFSQDIKNVVNPGDSVDVESMLCTVENPYGSDSSMWGDESDDIMKRLNSVQKMSDFQGTVEKIEVYYNGELDDMSESLRDLAMASDRLISRHSKLLYGTKTTGRTEPGFKVDNVVIPKDAAVVRFYITGPVSQGAGDKLVYGGQLKSIPGRVIVGECYTADDGKPVDAIFGYNSVLARIVESMSIMGFGNTLCLEVGQRVINAYRGKK